MIGIVLFCERDPGTQRQIYIKNLAVKNLDSSFNVLNLRTWALLY